MASGDVAGAAAQACPYVSERWSAAVAEIGGFVDRYGQDWATTQSVTAHSSENGDGGAVEVTFEIGGRDSGWVVSVVEGEDGSPQVCGSRSRVSRSPEILRAIGQRTQPSRVAVVLDADEATSASPPAGYRVYSDEEVSDAPPGMTRTVAYRKDDDQTLRLTALNYETPSRAARAVDRELDSLQPELLALDRHPDGLEAIVAAHGWLLAQPTTVGPYLAVARLVLGATVLEARAVNLDQTAANEIACATLRDMLPEGATRPETCSA